MTKAELIKFLEPFADDIEIVRYDDDYGEADLQPKYHVSNVTITNEHGIVLREKGTGYIAL